MNMPTFIYYIYYNYINNYSYRLEDGSSLVFVKYASHKKGTVIFANGREEECDFLKKYWVSLRK